MTATIHDFPARLTADAAWERYAILAARALDDPRLSLDRSFNERLIRAHAAFEHAFKSEEGLA